MRMRITKYYRVFILEDRRSRWFRQTTVDFLAGDKTVSELHARGRELSGTRHDGFDGPGTRVDFHALRTGYTLRERGQGSAQTITSVTLGMADD